MRATGTGRPKQERPGQGRPSSNAQLRHLLVRGDRVHRGRALGAGPLVRRMALATMGRRTRAARRRRNVSYPLERRDCTVDYEVVHHIGAAESPSLRARGKCSGWSVAGHELDRRGRRPLKTNQDSISHGELEGPAGVLSSACPFLLVALPCYGGSSLPTSWARRRRKPRKTNQDSISHGELEGPAGVRDRRLPVVRWSAGEKKEDL